MKHCSNQLAEGFEIQLISPLISIRAKIAVLFIGKINIFLSNAETNKKNGVYILLPYVVPAVSPALSYFPVPTL